MSRLFFARVFGVTAPRPAGRRLTAACAVLLLAAHCLPLNARSAAEGGWERRPSGTLAWLHSVHFVDARKGWAVGGKGALLSTDDGGRSWRAARSPSDDTLRDIFFTDDRTGWIVCERDLFRLRTNDEQRSYLLKTEDGGATWRRVELLKSDVNVRLVRVVFADAEHGWSFGEEGALFATADGGRTWARQRVPTRNLLLGASFRDARRGWLVGAGGTFLHTTDGGETWLAGSVAGPTARPAPRINAVSFIDERRGWAVGSGGAVYATADGGRSWRALDAGTDADLLDVKFFDEREGHAVGAGGTVLHTQDGGRRWAAESAGTRHQLERLFFHDRWTGWAVGFGGTIIGRPAGPAPQMRPARL